MADEHTESGGERPGQLLLGQNVEIITNQDHVKDLEPYITVRAIRPGRTEGQTFVVKINRPTGRPLLIAVHL